MIDITDHLISIAKEIDAFGGRVYRIYPQTNTQLKTFCTITPSGHNPTVREDGLEVVTEKSWTVQIVAPDPSKLDDLLNQLTIKYGQRNLVCTGTTYGYNADVKRFTVLATFSGTVDKRGWVFNRG